MRAKQDSNDTLFGGAANSVMYGGSESDLIFSGSGNDTLYGDASSMQTGGKSDAYVFMGNFGNDVLTEFAGCGEDDQMIFEFTADKVLLARDGDNLLFGIDGQADTVTVTNWFTNFGIDSFWFATGVEGQYPTLPVLIWLEYLACKSLVLILELAAIQRSHNNNKL